MVTIQFDLKCDDIRKFHIISNRVIINEYAQISSILLLTFLSLYNLYNILPIQSLIDLLDIFLLYSCYRYFFSNYQYLFSLF